MKFVVAMVATLTYIAILLAIYLIHALYFRVDVVFYAALQDAVLAAVITLLVALLFPYVRRQLSSFERTLLLVIWLLGGYAFAISGPAVLDRSLSVYIVEKLVQRGGGIQLDRIEDVFTKEYLVEHRLLDVRLTEQAESGTIEFVDGCVLVTDRGRWVARISRFLRTNFLPKQRLVMGDYSDDLTDPFRNSVDTPDYTCGPDQPD
jgi:hypothetical protein